MLQAQLLVLNFILVLLDQQYELHQTQSQVLRHSLLTLLAVGDNTGKVIIAGDLQVDGTTTTVNSTTVNIVDKNIQVATGLYE